MTILKIGLTGGIGCGKSTVCDLFAGHGASIIDADQIARQIVAPGKPALTQLSEHFGSSVLNSDGSLNRLALRSVIFDNEQARLAVNRIMHPLIYKEIEQQINQLQSVYCIVAVPLLFETAYQDKFDRVLVVDCDKDTQIQRVSLRDQTNLQEIESIINSQLSRCRRLELADDIISNISSIEILAEQVKKLHNSYTKLAKDRTHPA